MAKQLRLGTTHRLAEHDNVGERRRLQPEHVQHGQLSVVSEPPMQLADQRSGGHTQRQPQELCKPFLQTTAEQIGEEEKSRSRESGTRCTFN